MNLFTITTHVSVMCSLILKLRQSVMSVGAGIVEMAWDRDTDQRTYLSPKTTSVLPLHCEMQLFIPTPKLQRLYDWSLGMGE